MVFWGVELKPGEPYTLKYDSSLGRLRITQAISGRKGGYSTKEDAIVQCKVDKKSPISVCLLNYENGGTCTLDIEFEEKDGDVVLENTGKVNVHLSGYYISSKGLSGNVGTEKKAEDSASAGAVPDSLEEKQITEMQKVKEEENEYTDTMVEGRRVRTMSSGLVIEDLEMSKNTNTKVSTPGYDVSVSYTGQLKSNGFIFVSNVGRYNHRFSLGSGSVIEGLNLGINGMRAGDKRRLTIPPSMGYGSKGCQGVPPSPNAWLVYEVYVVEVY
ncbi:hypothetical protein MKW94_019475 [Papaver nudicaule]|uniref:peptidylprolyl isomerase n=1 Tax=Papaver nudicaule TaxID=74823 RepID=A0AA41V7S4_PAPNU|nr:hypothetical protein [Papaver nudicaule]